MLWQRFTYYGSTLHCHTLVCYIVLVRLFKTFLSVSSGAKTAALDRQHCGVLEKNDGIVMVGVYRRRVMGFSMYDLKALSH